MDEKLASLREYMTEMKSKDHPESYLIAILHKAQNIFGYLNTDIMNEISYTMNIPSAHIWGVATFYHYFTLNPPGKHVIHICLGTACFVKGTDKVLDALKSELGIDFNETTKDGLFSLREARCLGACAIAPVVLIDDKMYGKLTADKIREIIKDYRNKEEDIK